jgi:hypothetical protein
MIVLMVPMMMAVTPTPVLVVLSPSANILTLPVEPQKSRSIAVFIPTPTILVTDGPDSV